MHYPNLPEATLLVGGWHSYCNACGKECDWEEEAHDSVIGYGAEPDERGCGIRWAYVFSEYVGAGAEESVRSGRPDLEFLEWKD